jgi:glutaredoxin
MKNKPYTVMDAKSSMYFQKEFVAKGVRKVPQIFLGDRLVGGLEQLMGELL